MLVVAAISLAGVRSVRTTRWNAALAGASAIWFVPTLSRVMRWFSADFRFPNGIGTWAMYAGTGLAFAGGVVALIELRATSGDARTGSSGIVGFILGVLGVAVYGFSTSLTYFAQPPAPGPISLFSGLKHLPVVPTIAAVISVYGAAAVLAVISFGGMWGRRKDLWAAALLAGALAWSPKLAELINASVYEIGFWGVEAATVILLAAGAIAVAGTRRSSIASASTSEHAARDEP